MLLEELLPEDVWREPQPVLSVQGDVDWDPGIHDRYVPACLPPSFIHSFNHSIGRFIVPWCFASARRPSDRLRCLADFQRAMIYCEARRR